MQYLALMAALGQPDGHAEAWDYLADRTPHYPQDRRYWPWRRATRNDRRRPIAMVGFASAVESDDSTLPIVECHIVTPKRYLVVTPDNPQGMAMGMAEALFGPHTAKHIMPVADGSAWAFQSLIAHAVPHWVEAGYTITPIIGGHVIRCLFVRLGRRTWALTDLEACTGSSVEALTPPDSAPGPGASALEAHLRALAQAVDRLNDVSLSTFGVYLRPTTSGTAVRAAGFDLPVGVNIPRPPAMLVGMCRIGRAYRGGYVYGERYRGQAYKADVRRLYARALSEPLPTLWAMGHGIRDGADNTGVFMCTVSGSALHPITLPMWSGPDDGFVVRPYTGQTAIAVLPSTEYRGLRAMGLEVTPGWGWVGTHPMSLAPFIRRLQALITAHGSSSEVGRLAKLLANTLYGRLAVNPKRDDMVYAVKQPAGSSWPVVTTGGEIVDNLWAVETERYSPAQQVGAAALVTGWARSHLYVELARRIREGRRIVHVHTDGYVATGPAPDDLPWHTDTIGDWHLEAVDHDAIIARAAGYAIGAETRWSGTPHQGRPTIELDYTNRGWTLQGQRVAALGKS
jgi:hypothetical protein